MLKNRQERNTRCDIELKWNNYSIKLLIFVFYIVLMHLILIKAFDAQIVVTPTFIQMTFCCRFSASRSQFHQRFTREFFVQNFWGQNFKPKTQFCNFWHQILYKKVTPKTLMNLTPGVKYHEQLKSAKR